jgi:hypothetical protein
VRTFVPILSCALLISAGAVPCALGSQVLYMSPGDLAASASLVLRGRVESVESFWNPAHTKIFTRTRLVVDETYKGAARPTIDLVQLGGVVGALKVTAQGAQTWTPGEEALVFVEPAGPSDFRVSGFSQGKFRIVRDQATGVAYVEAAPTEGVNLIGAPAKPAGVLSRRQVTLEQFVLDALQGGGNPEVER